MTRPRISFVLPMYNEAGNVAETIRKASSAASEISDDYEIIFVDDASTDGCGEIVKAFAAQDAHVRLISLEKNTRFGGALSEGLVSAVKDVVIYTDADMPVKVEDIKKALELINEADVVTAYSLAVKDSSLKRVIISRLYNFTVRHLFGLDLKDINSGFKIYKKKLFEGMVLRSRSPFVDVEIFCECLNRGAVIAQYGLIFQHRAKGKSTIARPGILFASALDAFFYWIFR